MARSHHSSGDSRPNAYEEVRMIDKEVKKIVAKKAKDYLDKE